MIFIIGSGQTAIAAAMALVERGYRPAILDAGLQPTNEARELKRRLSSTAPEAWDESDLARFKRTGPVAANGIPRKLHFGSDFAFLESENATPVDVRQASVHRSFAAGGFSNVWGAVIQPLDLRDMRQWPVSPAEMAPHYLALHSLMRTAEPDSSITQPFPRRAVDPDLKPSKQAREFYADLASAGAILQGGGIRFEYARLAVLSADSDDRSGCRYCGQCVYGCPYDAVFTSTSALDQMIRSGRVRYTAGIVVDKLTPTGGHVLIEGRSLQDGSARRFLGKDVFVAAGLLETSRIILNSLGIYDTPVQVSHSDIFTLPLVRYRGAQDVFREKLHTLCQIVLEIEDHKICPSYVRLQLYGYNDLYPKLLGRRLGSMAPLLEGVSRAVAKRLFVAFGYLHSDFSSRITLALNRESKLSVVGQSNPVAERICRAVSKKLFQNRRYLRAVPLLFQLKMDLPGGGYHSGGSFPMRHSPGRLETDKWGSLQALPGIHIVDASVLPTVPASPLAFTVMANAHRIASLCEVQDGLQ